MVILPTAALSRSVACTGAAVSVDTMTAPAKIEGKTEGKTEGKIQGKTHGA
jgi:hypothetical protein